MATLGIADLITGLLVTLPTLGVTSLHHGETRFHQAVKAIMPDVEAECTTHGLDVDFRVHLHDISQRSQTVFDGLSHVMYCEIANLNWPQLDTLYVLTSADAAPRFQETLPGSPGMYRRLAERFIAEYEKEPT